MSDQIEFIDNLAAGLGVGDEARKKWRQRKCVPHRWRLLLMKAAAEKGEEIDTEIFDSFTSPKSPESPSPGPQEAA